MNKVECAKALRYDEENSLKFRTRLAEAHPLRYLSARSKSVWGLSANSEQLGAARKRPFFLIECDMPASSQRRLAFAATSLVVLAQVCGCSSSRLQARALPAEYRATPGGGMQRVQLGGLATTTRPSKAIDVDDLITLRIVTGLSGEEPIEQQVRVGRDGAIDAVHVGRVAVAGLEPAAAADQIASAAVSRGIFVRPQISVELTEPATNQITVLGAVSEPGVKELPRSGCDVLTAIAAAGGLTEEAGAVVELLHGGASQFASATGPAGEDGVQQVVFNAPAGPHGVAQGKADVIDLAHPESTSPERLRLADRDVIVVRPKQKRVIHVTGLVAHPNQFELLEEHDMRVLDAVAMAGGPSSAVADKVLVVRQTADHPEPLVIEVSLSRAKQDGAENLILQSGDLVSVESTVATATLDTFKNLFRITMGVGGNLTLF